MAIVKKYPSEVVSVENKIDNIYTVTFKSLAGNYKYSPGQFLHLALDEVDPSAGWPESRCFSMQSAPCGETIAITYAAKGSFTQRMASELKPGKTVTLKLPYGELFTDDFNREKVVFIAGGTGITPYLSLFCHSSFADYINPILYLGVRNQTLNIYKAEIEQAKSINPSLSVNIVCEDTDGRLSIEHIAKENGDQSVYFISGPPVMIKSFKTYLAESGINETNIKTDDWE